MKVLSSIKLNILMLYQWVLGMKWLCAVPFFLILLIAATDFLILEHYSDAAASLFYSEMPVPIDDSRRDSAEALKSSLLKYVYLLLIVLSGLHWRKILGYFKQRLHLVVLIGYLLFGIFYSIEPTKVITNTILILIGFLACVLFASAFSARGRYSSFYWVVFVPMLLVHIASLYIFSLYDTSIVDFLESMQRYGGLAGNPNSLGSTAVLGVWSAAGLLLSTSSSWKIRLLVVGGLILFFLNTALSGSGTSTIVIVFVLSALLWLKFLSRLSPKWRFIINGSLLLGAVFLCLYAMLFTTPAEFYLSVTSSMGKDATLTGRTELWVIAREAISMRPIFGWGFDSHQSVMAERAFDVRFNHYHNGFLDTILLGGFVLLGIVLYNFYCFIKTFLSVFRSIPNVFPLFLPLVIVILLNMSEYSLLRPNSQLWLVYFMSFALVTYSADNNLSVRIKWIRKERSFSTDSRKRKRGAKLRWG